MNFQSLEEKQTEPRATEGNAVGFAQVVELEGKKYNYVSKFSSFWDIYLCMKLECEALAPQKRKSPQDSYVTIVLL